MWLRDEANDLVSYLSSICCHGASCLSAGVCDGSLIIRLCAANSPRIHSPIGDWVMLLSNLCSKRYSVSTHTHACMSQAENSQVLITSSLDCLSLPTSISSESVPHGFRGTYRDMACVCVRVCACMHACVCVMEGQEGQTWATIVRLYKRVCV